MWNIACGERTLSILDTNLKSGRVPHAYLITGPQRVGKSTLALNIAQAVNCSSTDRPCGLCPSCLKIAQGKHSDISHVYVAKDKTEISIEQIKDVQRAASLKPFEGNFRVFIISGADQLSTEAANRLLKTLEEPPEQVLFILTTSKPEDVLQTIFSRCALVEMEKPKASSIATLLERSHGQEHGRAEYLARISRGAVGWAVECCSNERLLARREEMLRDLLRLEKETWDEKFAFAAELASSYSKSKDDLYDTLSLWESVWRDIILIRAGETDHIFNVDVETDLKSASASYEDESCVSAIKALEETWLRLEQNANPRLAMEVLMLSLPWPASMPA